MRKAIQDEFTNLDVSRQRKSQLRRIRDGLCPICGKPKMKDDTGKHDKNTFCEDHYAKHLAHTNRFNRKKYKVVRAQVKDMKESLGLKPNERADFNVWNEVRGI